MIKVIFASAIILLSATAHSQQSNDSLPKLRLTNRSLNISRDGDTKTSEVTVEDQSGKSYRVKKVNGKLTDFFVNGQKVSESEISKYNNVLNQISQVEQRNIEMAARTRVEANRRRGEVLQRQRMINIPRNQIMQQRQRELQGRIRENQARLNRFRPALQGRPDLMRGRVLNMQNQYRQQLNNMRNVPLRRTGGMYNPPMNEFNAILSELRRENLVSNPDDLTFSLDNNELVVNGKKQSSELHNKLKQRFIHKDGDVIKYSKKGNTTSTTLNRD